MSLPGGAALGSTKDPRALVVGEPGSLDHQAQALRTAAGTMETVGEDLQAVKTPSWEGPASNAFWARFTSEPRTWFQLHTLLTKAASAMADQATALRTAQNKAQDAIDLWEKGEQATKAAVSSYNDEAKRRADNAPIPGLSAPMPPFHDPGDALRKQAEEILEDARDTLDKAGLEATGTLCDLGGISWNESSGSASGPGAEASADGPEFTYGNDKNVYDKRAPWQKGRKAGDHDSKAELSLGSVSADAYVAKLEGETKGNYHGVDYDAKGDVKVLDVGADASASISNDGIKGSAGAHADLVNAHGEASATYGIATAKAEANGSVGADANVEAEIGNEGVHAGGEAFVGAKGDVSAGGDVGGVGGKVTAEGWVGAGAGADLDVGMHDGEIKVGGYVGAGLGLGGKVGGEITIDPEKVLDTGKDIVGGIGRLIS